MSGQLPAAGRPKMLLVITSIAFAIWIAVMLVMYFTTVYPQRHPTTKVACASRPCSNAILV